MRHDRLALRFVCNILDSTRFIRAHLPLLRGSITSVLVAANGSKCRLLEAQQPAPH